MTLHASRAPTKPEHLSQLALPASQRQQGRRPTSNSGQKHEREPAAVPVALPVGGAGGARTKASLVWPIQK